MEKKEAEFMPSEALYIYTPAHTCMNMRVHTYRKMRLQEA